MPRVSDEERAVRRFCLECQGGSASAVRSCSDMLCALFPVRFRTTSSAQDATLRVLRLVRAHCLICAGNRRDVRSCDARPCPLWSYRFGVLPATFKRVVARHRLRKQQSLTLF